jgi:hypothetical protein
MPKPQSINESTTKVIHTYADKSVYKGFLKDRKRHHTFADHGEYAKFTFKNKDVYVGEFEDNKRHGQGKLTFAADQSYFEGTWDQDKFIKGTYKGQGFEYEGSFEQGEFHGQGKLMKAAGYSAWECYTGDWSQGKRNGNGTQVYPDETKY